MDYEDGELDEQSHLQPEAKQNMSGETVDHDTNPLGTDTPVSISDPKLGPSKIRFLGNLKQSSCGPWLTLIRF